MRFEDRLRTRFDVADEAQGALLPSLLLQPLVENAIKYAVTPLEEGAEITVAAQLVGPMLRITVSDTGPGLQLGDDPFRPDPARSGATITATGEPVSTGVGLANIRDRLAQAYGEEQRFDIQDAPEGGFAVVIELPFEARQPAVPSSPPASRLVTAG
jgi:sensor histidine kinase YesM